ncbi:MAG: hypothetical protein ACRERU_20780 [Methylococcales bacterium]
MESYILKIALINDGVFSGVDEGVRFHPAFLTDATIARVQQQTRRRVLNLFQHRGLLPSEAGYYYNNDRADFHASVCMEKILINSTGHLFKICSARGGKRRGAYFEDHSL